MTVEATIVTTLTGLVSGRVFPDVAPELTSRPFIVYQQIGGQAINFMDPTVPNVKRYRFQISIWGDTRAAVSALAILVEDALRAATTLQTTVEGASVAVYEQDTKLRGSYQDFSFVA